MTLCTDVTWRRSSETLVTTSASTAEKTHPLSTCETTQQTQQRKIMKTNRTNTLTLRAHSIRTLTPAELRVAAGGCAPGCHDTCGGTKALTK
jgi:hypothetical protein